MEDSLETLRAGESNQCQMSIYTTKSLACVNQPCSPEMQMQFLVGTPNLRARFNLLALCHRIPFGDHPLKLERYRED